jgi:hypothetical protein
MTDVKSSRKCSGRVCRCNADKVYDRNERSAGSLPTFDESALPRVDDPRLARKNVLEILLLAVIRHPI